MLDTTVIGEIGRGLPWEACGALGDMRLWCYGGAKLIFQVDLVLHLTLNFKKEK